MPSSANASMPAFPKTLSGLDVPGDGGVAAKAHQGRLCALGSWWKDAEILMLRHQLAVAEREHPGAYSRLTWPDRAWLALLAGALPIGRLAVVRLVVTPGTVLRWHRDIVRRRWACRSRQGRSGWPPTGRKVDRK